MTDRCRVGVGDQTYFKFEFFQAAAGFKIELSSMFFTRHCVDFAQ